MKFVKENLTLVICGVVVVLFLVFAWAPLPYMVPSLNDALKTQMQERWNYGETVKGWAKESIELPGGLKDKGIPPQVWVDKKNKLIKDMEQQQKEVEDLAKQYNYQGRLENGVPMLPLMSAEKQGIPIPGYLPKVTGDAMAYKMNYGQLPKRWTGLLATGTPVDMEPEAAMPQRVERLRTDWGEAEKVRMSKMPPGSVTSGSTGSNTKAERDYYKRMLTSRATGLQMYVMDGAFQMRDWYTGTTQPDETQIFNSLVDSWLQADVVKAIAAVNGTVLKGLPSAADRNVFKSPVKRLTSIVVGNNARVQGLSAPAQSASSGSGPQTVMILDPGPLFFTSANANNTGGGSSALVSVTASNMGQLTNPPGTKIVLPDTPNQTDYNLGMTGRSAGKTHDVVYMSVVLEIDPAYLNKFIDSLYRQNMCYTVTNLQMRSVDPLARASEGYLYGDVPVVEVQMLVECLLFRSWTEAVMPDAVKISLGGTVQQPG
jgi:hypothetical protein